MIRGSCTRWRSGARRAPVLTYRNISSNRVMFVKISKRLVSSGGGHRPKGSLVAAVCAFGALLKRLGLRLISNARAILQYGWRHRKLIWVTVSGLIWLWRWIRHAD